jgi:asparagine synthase (glutamine-hydrolysing)
MCGIAGWFETIGNPEKVSGIVSSIVRSMHHRGPDAEKMMIISDSPTVVLGHSRLAIIDLSPAGSQPMTDKLSGNTIVYNGELYNFRILKKELEDLGHQFISQSDTEVVLKSYSEWGQGCCKKFRGIFAFAIWDMHRQKLFIARDPMGVKPFYYFLSEGKLVFASEVRALLASEVIPRKLDFSGLESYLAYGSVQEPFTMINGVRSLPPGHNAFYNNSDGLALTRYWEPAKNTLAHSESEIREIVHESLKETLKMQLVSDVPLGIFLSGGIDSSAIVSLVRQVYNGHIKTFSIIFEDPVFDERKYAKMVSDANSTDHLELELTSKIIVDNLKVAINDFDQPSLDGLNTWFVSKLVKEAGLTVALSGVGGDELFVGYGGFKKALMMEQVQPALSFFPKSLGKFLLKHSQKEQIRRTGEMMGFKHPGYFLSRKVFSSCQRSQLLKDSFLISDDWFDTCFRDLISEGKTLNGKLTQISYYELRSYMLSTLLRDTDQMSMAHSLEVRVPLIDPEIVQLLLSVPDRFKKNKKSAKPLLVAAAGKGIPEECINRPKQGFSFPFDQFFKESLGNEIVSFFNENESLVFKKEELNRLWNKYVNGGISWSRIWTLFVLGWWMKQNKIES